MFRAVHAQPLRIDQTMVMRANRRCCSSVMDDSLPMICYKKLEGMILFCCCLQTGTSPVSQRWGL